MTQCIQPRETAKLATTGSLKTAESPQHRGQTRPGRRVVALFTIPEGRGREQNFYVEAGERAKADPPPTPTSPGRNQPTAMTFPASAPLYDVNFEGSMTAMVEDNLAGYLVPCPQGSDCAGDGQHRRIFDCEQGCGFRGCAACMEVHEAEPHVADSATMREMVRSIGGVR